MAASADTDEMLATVGPETELDALVVGAGFGGIYALYKLKQLGLKVRSYEKGAGVGGTWFWNRYPGARCDVPSMEYSYSFSEELQQEWEWTELYATQPEIERYINHVVDRFDLRGDIEVNCEIASANYDAEANLWRVVTANGRTIAATYLILTTGGYHLPIKPDLPGLESFSGEVYFSNQWPTDVHVDYTGKAVGLIGTGSSGVQTAVAVGNLPVKSLTIFQRTAGYIVPAHNRPLTPAAVAEHKRNYSERRERARHSGYGVDVTSFPAGTGSTMVLTDAEFNERANKMWQAGGGTVQTAFPDFVTDEAANKRVADWINAKLTEGVNDPALVERIKAKGHYLGAKRIIIIDGYKKTLTKPNVSLVDVKANPIKTITPRGVCTTQREYLLDMLIVATGFDSATGSILKIDINGRNGQSLRDKWAHGHLTYLGLGANGFPNMFFVAQVGSPGIRSAMVVSIEQHVDWIADLLIYAREHRIRTIEPTAEAERTWTQHVADVAASTLLTRDDTQHLGSNVPGKPRVVTSYLGGVGAYRKLCELVRAHDYEGWQMMTEDGAMDNAQDWSGPNKTIRWEDRDQEVGQAVGFL